MTEKKIVDDYYSQIKGDKEDLKDQEKQDNAAKKKIIIKKAVKLDDEKDIQVSKSEENVKTEKPKFEKKPKIVQKIEVVKRVDKVDKPEKPESKNYKRTDNNYKKPVHNNHNVKNDDKTKPSVNHSTNGSNFSKEQSSSNVKKESGFSSKPGKSNFKGKKIQNFDDDSAKKKFSKASQPGKTRGKFKFHDDDDLVFLRSNKLQKLKKIEKQVEDIKQNLVEKKGETVIIPDFLSLKELSEKIGIILPKLIAEFMKNGMMVNINSKIDFETASIIGEAFDIKLERDNSNGMKVEDIILGDMSSLLTEDDPTKLIPRSPVVSIMGHVDHGKTSLLDYIRKSRVASGEAGGITQSIGAYQVELEGGNITFLDTPGHEAFTIMRARGAKLTDIAVLVVAADEGVKPQTLESISHARQANIPIIVAINKMDKEGANPDYVKGQLADQGLVAEDWGGDVPMVPVSALTGFGVDDLLDMILLMSEMKELKANPDRNGVATVIESHLDSNLGPVVTALINTGTIRSGDNIVCHDSYGKVKILKNYLNQKIKLATSGEPVLIVGLDKVVEGGDILQVVNSPEIAKQKALEYKTILERQKKSTTSGLELLMSKIKSGNLKQLKVVLKADTNGSLEAIKNALQKLSTSDTEILIIHAGVGSITEGDILMGQGSDSILIGYGVGVLPTAKGTLESLDVQFISSDIIYHITDKVGKIITGMLDPKEVEIILGRARVGGIFYTEKKFLILGLQVPPESRIENNTSVRILRKKQMIGTGKIESLKEGTLEVKEIEGPKDCGIKLVTNTKVEIGDDLEVYKIEIQK